ncbi:MAG: pyridoxamine 5-phosphate oxidase family protein [Burkholderiales bacterium]|jgi:predicted pyridoxine 5'-phosphate oxidase superfamily flavin-nucleotide-binding protein|nr:pyridoxamine 5-phosphate oxidase family protein [Burkholderiales bacterium]
MSHYHERARELQDRFDTRRLADRLAEQLSRTAFTEEDRAFIESRMMFFLATADAQGRPDCSYKGGMPGFVRVTGPSELSFPSYDGNGMFRTLGNILANPGVGMLFLDFDQPRRLRVNGKATVTESNGEFEGAQLVVRVQAEAIFPNCPRYLHRMQLVEPSVYAPRPGHEPPEPGWKQRFKDVLPKG